VSHLEEEEKEMKKSIINSLPSSMPIINKQFSLKPDMMFGYELI
jgi:myosin-crossreactive antigen